jgi:hypothetical protein
MATNGKFVQHISRFVQDAERCGFYRPNAAKMLHLVVALHCA